MFHLHGAADPSGPVICMVLTVSHMLHTRVKTQLAPRPFLGGITQSLIW